ncbi:MAG: ABC transporter permease [Candidatus Rokubacteria bacterium]|nr:ABC transporter permease [Candidatus Rokubacteria bacterium]
MGRFLLRRFLFMLVTMLVVSAIVFVISEVVPIDVARNILGPYASPESLEHLRRQMGLDQPVPVRYWRWLTHFVQGDMGISSHYAAPVASLLGRRLLNSGVLAAAAFALIMPLALLLGVVAGMREGGRADRLISLGSLVSTSIPTFASGVFLILIFTLWLGWLPGSSVLDQETWAYQAPLKLIMPVLALVLVDVGYVARMTRVSMAEVMASAYVRTAILKGLPYRRVIVQHALRNALLAPITVIMLHINWLMGGIVVVEFLFGFHGFGWMMLDASLNKDVQVIEAGAMVAIVIAVGTQLIADLLYTALNPRIRLA